MSDTPDTSLPVQSDTSQWAINKLRQEEAKQPPSPDISDVDVSQEMRALGVHTIALPKTSLREALGGLKNFASRLFIRPSKPRQPISEPSAS